MMVSPLGKEPSSPIREVSGISVIMLTAKRLSLPITSLFCVEEEGAGHEEAAWAKRLPEAHQIFA